MKAVLFDCDGTLADSFGIIVSTMMDVFRESGLPEPSVAQVEEIIGLSLATAIGQLVPIGAEGDVAVMTERYRTLFHQKRNAPEFEEALFEGAGEMLHRLAGRGDLRLGMVTGKSRRGVRLVVEAHGLDGVFTAVRTADDCPSKPHPDMVLECCAELGIAPGSAVVVGDSIYDMQMARAAGSHAIGVAWGAATPQTLRQAGAMTVAETMPALFAELERWADAVREGAM